MFDVAMPLTDASETQCEPTGVMDTLVRQFEPESTEKFVRNKAPGNLFKYNQAIRVAVIFVLSCR